MLSQRIWIKGTQRQIGIKIHRILIKIALRPIIEEIGPSGEGIELLELIRREQLAEGLVGGAAAARLQRLELGVELGDAGVEFGDFVGLARVGVKEVLVF